MENYIYKGDRYSLEIGTSAIRVYQDGVRVTETRKRLSFRKL